MRLQRTLCILTGLLASAAPVLARELTFEQRVEAQRAIERVYYSHQIGATQPFEAAVQRQALEQKVRKYLAQSVALEQLWNTPVTAEMLQREQERMAQGTRLPDQLNQLYAALGHDSFLVQECLARATLVDRLTRSRFADDPTIHAEPRKEAEALWAEVATGKRNPSMTHPRRTLIEFVQFDRESDAAGPRPSGRPEAARAEQLRRVELSPEDFRKERVRFPGKPGQVGRLADEREAFVFRVVLDQRPGEVLVATFAVPKTPWAEWWDGVRGGFEGAAVAPVASEPGGEPSASTCQPDDAWDNGVLDDAPDPAELHTAIWTGSRMIVWGGTLYYSGGSYDPVTDSWTPMSMIGAPSPRLYHTAVWTGGRMIVWGGVDIWGSPVLDTGGRYDPLTDSWTPTSSTNAPSPRQGHVAVWAANRMVVWGGRDAVSSLDTGGLYDPATDSWVATSTTGAPPPRQDARAVSTGSRMIVWGGHDGSTVLDTGGVYDPATNDWTSTTMTGAPSPRTGHTVVWTGSRMIVWGVTEEIGTPHGAGGLYDPAMDSWTSTSTIGAPFPRTNHTAVWTGSRMIVWGGRNEFYFNTNTGGVYDPLADGWVSTSTTSAPSPRFRHTAVWTGSRMIVWGGFNYDVYDDLDTGGLYDPLTNSWTLTSAIGAPSPRSLQTAVWTGSQMIVWGGSGGSATTLDTGGRYDPVTDHWEATSLTNAPVSRVYHTAVWTGNRMIVWGGGGYHDSWAYLDTGASYDPVADDWVSTSTTGAPAPRTDHTAVWSEGRMIVWGGFDGYDSIWLNAGALYDPVANAWTPMSTAGAPSHRGAHTAVATESGMIVWGGWVPRRPVGHGRPLRLGRLRRRRCERFRRV